MTGLSGDRACRPGASADDSPRSSSLSPGGRGPRQDRSPFTPPASDPYREFASGRYMPEFVVGEPRRPLGPIMAAVVAHGVVSLMRRYHVPVYGAAALVAARMDVPKRRVRAWTRHGVQPRALAEPFAEAVEELERAA